MGFGLSRLKCQFLERVNTSHSALQEKQNEYMQAFH